MMKTKLNTNAITLTSAFKAVRKPALVATLLLGGAFSNAASFAAEVNVYSGRKEALIKPLV